MSKIFDWKEPFENYRTVCRKSAMPEGNSKYRYVLQRIWDSKKSPVVFIGLNPSIANHDCEDRTILKCVRYAHSWGYGGITMLNAFAFRDQNPEKLFAAGENGLDFIVGDENDKTIKLHTKKSKLVIACWGTNGNYMGRYQSLSKALEAIEVKALKLSKYGFPRHPLYLSGKISEDDLVRFKFSP